MDKIVSTLDKHELEIEYIKKSLTELVEYSKETTKQLQKISDSISKQEVILEKISNLEDKYHEGSKRLHSRVDAIEKQIDNEKDGMLNRLNRVEKECDQAKQDIINRPCRTHSVIENELKHIDKRLNMHQKIFWTAISTIMVIVIGAIVKGALK